MNPPEVESLGTILLIDDEDGIRRLVARILERLGYQVLSADGGQHGIDLYNETGDGLHAVMLDLSMPHMDGATTFRNLREAGCEAPIFIMSGYVEKSMQLDLPVAGYVAKPIDLATLQGQLADCGPRL